ncbi:disulfide bond formation protein B [Enterobacter sp. 22466]|uniref:disulfide bond formation protein B n=1 Tax=Enterobacter sp. 22466 TaxID=3453924 RepID=UPI003F82C92D
MVAFYYQFDRNELPCPLCLLQRTGLIITGLAFLFNIRFGIKGGHYSIAILGAIITGSIAVRQILLHIMPRDAGYGSVFLGLHFYTWSLVTSVLILMAITLMLSLSGSDSTTPPSSSRPGMVVMLLFCVLLAINLLSTFLECGFGECADNPLHYLLLQK